MEGATGLDGASCVALLDRLMPRWKRELDEVKDGDRLAGYDVPDALEDIHVMELVTLQVWGDRRAEAAAQRAMTEAKT